MFENNISIADLSVNRATTHKNLKRDSRVKCGFYFKLSGSAEYTVNNIDFFINEGDFLFLPARCSYKVREIVPGEYISVNFNIIENSYIPEPTLFSGKAFPNCKETFLTIYKNSISAEDERNLLCVSELYSLIYKINISSKYYTPSCTYSVIQPAIEYLDKHIFDSNLELEKIAEISNISYIYFEKLFRKYFNLAPKKYIIKKRINYAKNIFESGDFSTIASVSESVGYEDPLYFSRLFKKNVGVSPKMYINGFE